MQPCYFFLFRMIFLWKIRNSFRIIGIFEIVNTNKILVMDAHPSLSKNEFDKNDTTKCLLHVLKDQYKTFP